MDHAGSGGGGRHDRGHVASEHGRGGGKEPIRLSNLHRSLNSQKIPRYFRLKSVFSRFWPPTLFFDVRRSLDPDI
jgi:hypothetical protein